MTFFKDKKICLLLAALMMMAAAGCSDSGEGESSAADSSQSGSAAESAVDSTADSPDSTADSDTTTESVTESGTESTAEEYTPGEGLAAAAALFEGAYTYTASVTYSDYEGTAQVVQASDGERFYQSITETGTQTLAADNEYIFDGEQAYTIDNNIGAYAAAEQTQLNIFSMIIENRLDRTSTHIPEDTEGYTVEEYTYAGDTYLTVYDIYFDEEGVAKYTATYTVEGEDDIVQTVEILSITDTAEESLFDTERLGELFDFEGATEDERLGFCQGVCSAGGISTDDMYEMDITTDDFKRIDFESFRELVYSYAEQD